MRGLRKIIHIDSESKGLTNSQFQLCVGPWSHNVLSFYVSVHTASPNHCREREAAMGIKQQ